MNFYLKLTVQLNHRIFITGKLLPIKPNLLNCYFCINNVYIYSDKTDILMSLEDYLLK